MKKFNTQYDKRALVFQEPGSPIHVIYSPKYTDEGVLDLFVSGQENLYDMIQSHKESTDIHVLLDRFASGETDVLQRMQGFYGDITSMPKTYAEVLNAVIAGEETFARLPIEIKQRFNNSFSEWLTSMDKPDFAEKMADSPVQFTPQQTQDFASSSGVAPSAPPPGAAERSGVAPGGGSSTPQS